MKQLVICLFGPTAIGKSELAIYLAQKLPITIISVDSAMVYKGLDIGTSKPTKDILSLIPHKLIDILDPTENYSVGRFCEDVKQEINNSISNGKIPLLVGGTMMYFRAIQKGFYDLPSTNQSVRSMISQLANKNGIKYLYELLKEIDMSYAQKLHVNDSQRIKRALEVYFSTGEKMSFFVDNQAVLPKTFQLLNFAILPFDRASLHKKIETRFDTMIENGLINEVEQLIKDNKLSESTPSYKLVGYKQVTDYVLGKHNANDMRNKSVFATRQLAKRQITWIRSFDDKTVFLDTDNIKEMLYENINATIK